MRLLVISNHPPERWSAEQKAGWDEIRYIPFPDVDPSMSRENVVKLADGICEKITNITGIEWTTADTDGYPIPVPVICRRPNDGWRICVQGEYTLCAEILSRFGCFTNLLVFPTTERTVVEKETSEGVKKESVFKFVQWR